MNDQEIEAEATALMKKGEFEAAKAILHKLGEKKKQRAEAVLCKIEDPSCESCQ